ncbi:MAG: hypothetical protein QXI27_06335 [Nitrososphaerota archaeon]
MVKIVFSPKALEIIENLRNIHKKLYMIISDTGCCGYSNVHLSAIEPRGEYVYHGEIAGVSVYLRPPLDVISSYNEVTIEALPTDIDDSLSLETTMRYRFVLSSNITCKK